MTKKEWEDIKTSNKEIPIIVFFTYYIENLHKSPIKQELKFHEFEIYFVDFLQKLQMMEMTSAFIGISDDIKTLFSSGRSYYISQQSIAKKVADYFDNKKNW